MAGLNAPGRIRGRIAGSHSFDAERINMSVKIMIEVPEEALSILRRSPEEFAAEMKISAVCKWYELGWISQSKAAEVADVSRARFLELLSLHGVPAFQSTPAELRAEAIGG